MEKEKVERSALEYVIGERLSLHTNSVIVLPSEQEGEIQYLRAKFPAYHFWITKPGIKNQILATNAAVVGLRLRDEFIDGENAATVTVVCSLRVEFVLKMKKRDVWCVETAERITVD